MIVLIGNYAHDHQQSMQRFQNLLAEQFTARGEEVMVLAPQPLFGRLIVAGHGLGKWLGYLDKYVLFPWQLRRTLRWLSRTSTVVHICDHSNSMYLRTAQSCGFRTAITCHDLGAVRGALGEDTDCPASSTGKILQQWIRRSLGFADRIICVSSATESDVVRLVRNPEGKVPATRTVLLGQNSAFQPMNAEAAQAALPPQEPFLSRRPFLLHVGSSLPRKNRQGIVETFLKIKDQWPGVLVFAGQRLSAEVRAIAEKAGIANRVFELENVSNAQMEALYSRAFALFFPSKFEGFGWPIIEAQACGCPVLSSNSSSLAEVAGDSAFVAAWNDYEAFGQEILRMANEPSRRQAWISRGFENIKRFETTRMIQDYLNVYRGLCPAALSSPS